MKVFSCCIAALVLRIVLPKKTVVTNKVQVEFEVSSIMNVTSDAIVSKVKENDTLYFQSNNEEIGYIELIEKNNNYIYIESDDGEVLRVINPAKADLLGIATLNCVDSPNGYLINGEVELKKNTILYVFTNTSIFEMRITNILK